MGISSAVVGPIGLAALAEIFGVTNLGQVRSGVETINIISTSLSPFLFGIMIDNGYSMPFLSQLCLIYVLVASSMAGYALLKARAV